MADRAATRAEAQDRLELLEAELEKFVKVASEEFGAERIIVFGSLVRAMEEGAEALGEWSDLDLVVVAETKQPFYRRTRDLLLRVRPRVGADIFVYTPSEWKQMKSDRPFVKNEMLEKGRVVYARTGGQGRRRGEEMDGFRSGGSARGGAGLRRLAVEPGLLPLPPGNREEPQGTPRPWRRYPTENTQAHGPRNIPGKRASICGQANRRPPFPGKLLHSDALPGRPARLSPGRLSGRRRRTRCSDDGAGGLRSRLAKGRGERVTSCRETRT